MEIDGVEPNPARLGRYQKLDALLGEQQWKRADEETYHLMITMVGKRVGQYFTSEELLRFPCQALKAIDELWVKYSKGHLGFSVQKDIYIACGGRLDGECPSDEIWEKFGDRIGWRKNNEWLDYEQLDPSFSSPHGILPYIGVPSGRRVVWGITVTFFLRFVLFSRTKACEL